MHSRNEYLKVLRERYLKGRTKKEKTEVERLEKAWRTKDLG